MFMRFEPTKSTKGASKMRRDLINAEISKLRDLLPLPPTTRQRLSQLQLMALVCVYVRKMNYFQQLVKSHDLTYKFQESDSAPSIGFSKALSGFIMMLTQTGKLLYVSENAAEYLGHSMEDLLIHGDSIYDIIDRQDHQVVQTELNRGATGDTEEVPKIRNFLCRMNVSRNARRQLRFGDQKVVLVKGHFFSHLPLCSRNEPVFLAMCTPLAMPETRECVVHGATNVFTTVHGMDMKILHMDTNAEHYLGWEKSQLTDASWYQLLHWDSLREAQIKHRLITQSVQDKCCILLVRMQKKCGQFIWVHVVLQVKDATDTPHQLVVATNQVLSDTEASIMMKNSWLYQYYGYQNQPCPLPIDPRCQKFFRREQAYPEYQEQYVCSTEGEDYYAGPFVQRTEEEWCRGYPGRPVDYSTHSPQSSLSDERSPHHYDYPTEVSLQGEIYVYPNTTPTKLEHEHLHYGIPEDVPSTIVSSEYNGDYDYSKIEYGKRMRVAPPPLCLEGTDGIDRWNPSPPWSDTALQKIPEHQRFTYQHIPLTPTERLATT